MFVIPPVGETILTPAGVRRELRCDERTLLVEAADSSSVPPPVSGQPRGARLESANHLLMVAGVAALILIVIAIAWPRARRARHVRQTTRSLVRETPVETRIAVDEWLMSRKRDPSLLVRELSEQGDAYRALRSLLDAAERDRIVAERGEIRARIRELVASFSGTSGV
jgi:hypothetical protein